MSLWFNAPDLRRGRRLEPRVFTWMSAEAIALTWVFGLVISSGTAKLLAPFATLAIGEDQPSMGICA